MPVQDRRQIRKAVRRWLVYRKRNLAGFHLAVSYTRFGRE